MSTKYRSRVHISTAEIVVEVITLDSEVSIPASPFSQLMGMKVDLIWVCKGQASGLTSLTLITEEFLVVWKIIIYHCMSVRSLKFILD